MPVRLIPALLLLAAAAASSAEPPTEPPAREIGEVEQDARSASLAPSLPASGDETRREVALDYSTVPMLRNASLALASAQTASRALDLAAEPLLGGVLARRDGWGIASRLFWAVSIDQPLSHVAAVLNHEYGHATRLPDDAVSSVRLTGSYPFFGGEAACRFGHTPAAVELLANVAGGWEAGSLFTLESRRLHAVGFGLRLDQRPPRARRA